MDIAGYVSVCVKLYCVGFHCLSLHVSAYMAIFKCVGFFIYLFSYAWRILLCCFFFFGSLSFFHVFTLHVFHLCFVPVLFSFYFFVSLRVCSSACSFFVVCLFCIVLFTPHNPHKSSLIQFPSYYSKEHEVRNFSITIYFTSIFGPVILFITLFTVIIFSDTIFYRVEEGHIKPLLTVFINEGIIRPENRLYWLKYFAVFYGFCRKIACFLPNDFQSNKHATIEIYLQWTLNFVASVRKRTIPAERPPLVSEVSANFLRIEGATWSAWRIPTAVFSAF
jgi:hypothetical protein